MEYLKKTWRFLVKSSGDPERVSTTIKGFGLAVVTFTTANIIPSIDIVCGLGFLCDLDVDGFISTLNLIIDTIAAIVYYGLLMVSSLVGAYGLFRKLFLTFEGQNPALRK